MDAKPAETIKRLQDTFTSASEEFAANVLSLRTSTIAALLTTDETLQKDILALRRAAGEIHDRVEATFLAHLREQPPSHVIAFVKDLGDLGLELLVDALRSDDGAARKRAIEAFKTWGQDGERVVPMLLKLVAAEQERLRTRNCSLEAVMGVASDRLAMLPLLLRSMRTPELQWQAAKEIVGIGPEVLQALPRLLQIVASDWVCDFARETIARFVAEHAPETPGVVRALYDFVQKGTSETWDKRRAILMTSLPRLIAIVGDKDMTREARYLAAGALNILAEHRDAEAENAVAAFMAEAGFDSWYFREVKDYMKLPFRERA